MMTTTQLGVAFCGQNLTEGNEVQLLPAGHFNAIDGRPKDAKRWYIDKAIARKLIQKIAGRKNALVIDYEHQTLSAMKSGQPAPAAGWFKKLVWREGKGLFAVDVEWTKKARRFIQAKEYRYLSPVLQYDKTTGAILNILNAAITNFPAIDGMNTLAALNAQSNGFNPSTEVAGLTPEEKEISQKLGIAAEDYLATKNKIPTRNKVSLQAQHSGLSAIEQTVCHKLGLEAADYVQTKGLNESK